MKFKINLNFKSPILIGKKAGSKNFISSDEIIKGSVIRAAFAKVILNNCPFKNEPIDGKVNWVGYRGNKCPEGCKFKEVCKKFGNINFSYFYPKGSEIIPLTAMACKTNPEHGYIDCLIDNTECLTCGKGSRVEFSSGLRTTLANKKPFDKIKKNISVKTSINPYSRTSADGMLYSIETVTETGKNEVGEVECIFEGEIEGLSEKELNLFKRLRVGGDTTVGLGKCELQINNNSSKQQIVNIENFSEKYCKKQKIKKTKEINFAAIKFIGDLKVDFDTAEKNLRDKNIISDEYITTEHYKKIWEEALGIYNEKDITIEKIYTELINYRGYDTSKGNNKRSKAYVMASKGTVIVFKGKGIKEYLEKHTSIKDVKMSFGNDTEVGFGKYVLYDGR
ncbi:MAG: hypothetical protein E7214_10730 [Clostridium sp.]|nr:hypothetical protein [Clostridium sp.]